MKSSVVSFILILAFAVGSLTVSEVHSKFDKDSIIQELRNDLDTKLFKLLLETQEFDSTLYRQEFARIKDIVVDDRTNSIANTSLGASLFATVASVVLVKKGILNRGTWKFRVASGLSISIGLVGSVLKILHIVDLDIEKQREQDDIYEIWREDIYNYADQITLYYSKLFDLPYEDEKTLRDQLAHMMIKHSIEERTDAELAIDKLLLDLFPKHPLIRRYITIINELEKKNFSWSKIPHLELDSIKDLIHNIQVKVNESDLPFKTVQKIEGLIADCRGVIFQIEYFQEH